MTKGYYSLIQYCPDFARAEAVNVGALVFRPEPAAMAVRVVQDVRFVGKRLGKKLDEAMVQEAVQATHYRLTHDSLRSVEDLERFAKSRGNDVLLTLPRPMRVGEVEQDVDALFRELVTDGAPVLQRSRAEPSPVQQAFERMADRLPDRVFVGKEFRSRSLGVSIRSDYAYRNGCLNLVRSMPACNTTGEAEDSAYAMAKQGEIAQDLLDGPARFHVVSMRPSKKSEQMEEVFGRLVSQLRLVHFVPSAAAADWVNEVQDELSGH
jgi:hypothetical protein